MDGETMKPLGGALVLICDPVSDFDWLGHGQVSELRATGDGFIPVKAIEYSDIEHLLIIAKSGYFAAELYSSVRDPGAGYWYVDSPTTCPQFFGRHDPEFQEELRRVEDAVKLWGWPRPIVRAVTTDKHHSQNIVVPLYPIKKPTTAASRPK